MPEDHGTVEDDGAAHGPDALLDRSINVKVVLPDFDHARTDRSVDDDFARQTAECHLSVEPYWQFLRHPEGKHLEVKPDGFNHVDGPYDI